MDPLIDSSEPKLTVSVTIEAPARIAYDTGIKMMEKAFDELGTNSYISISFTPSSKDDE